MFTVSNLHFSHRARGRTQPIFRGLSFELPRGENLSVVGPSGCGKSTLLFLLLGLLKPDEGGIFFEGRKIERPSRERMIVFQDHALLPWLTCLKNVIFSLETHPNPPADREAVALSFLKKVGLENFAGHYPGELSGGMRQRLGIARALATDPKLLLLDEPFSSLDAITRDRISAEMAELLRREKKTAVLVTHDVGEALRFAHNTLILGGREPLFLKSNEIEKEEVYAAWMDRA